MHFGTSDKTIHAPGFDCLPAVILLLNFHFLALRFTGHLHAPLAHPHVYLAAIRITSTFPSSFPCSSGAMASWYSTRSRSRTTSRHHSRGAGSSSRPSTSTSSTRTHHDNSIPLREATAFRTLDNRPASWRSPARHVLLIVNFQDLADLSSRTQQVPDNADLLDAACRVYLDAIDENSLFTRCRHFDHQEAIQTPIGNLCNLISIRIRDTWDIRIPGTSLELRAYDLWGDTVQLDAEKNHRRDLGHMETPLARIPNYHDFRKCPLQVPKAPIHMALILSSHYSWCHFALTSLRSVRRKDVWKTSNVDGHTLAP